MHLTKGLYPFWDDLMTDHRFTDATLSVNRPIKVGTVFKADKPWEGNKTNDFSIIKDTDRYRMYYLGWNLPFNHPIFLCYAESKDGITWEKPSLGIYEFQGNKDNSILMEAGGGFAMKDANPACPPDEVYKLFVWENQEAPDAGYTQNDMFVYTSGDGVHFKKHHVCITPERYVNMYDSLNTIHWDRHTQQYICYFRCTHPKPTSTEHRYDESFARAIRLMTSSDCVHWSVGTPLDYLGGMDYQTYTNCVSPYLYDDRYYIGFPTRYVERLEWNDSFEKLTGKEYRKQRMEMHPRYGLTITDGVFMSSRDKYRWFRFDEACLTPGPEDGYNWEYGDCYQAVGLIETPERFPGNGPELSLLCEAHHWTDIPAELIRYVYRKDGFASYKATFKPQTLRTKPFTFEGNTLKLNFRTSARGYIQLKFLDEYNNPIEGFVSCEHFGDTPDRIIGFDRPLSEINNRAVKLEFIMSDAELFSFSLE